MNNENTKELERKGRFVLWKLWDWFKNALRWVLMRIGALFMWLGELIKPYDL